MAHKSNPYKKAGLGWCGDVHLVQLYRCQGPLEVPMEVEEEAHPPPAKEAPKDAPAIEVRT